MSEQLKSCPFCGSTVLDMHHTMKYWVVCEICHAEGPTRSKKDEAVQAWNTRAGEGNG